MLDAKLLANYPNQAVKILTNMPLNKNSAALSPVMADISGFADARISV